MKKLILLLLSAILISSAQAQNPKVENSISGIQLGFTSLSIYNETSITNNMVIRGELKLQTYTEIYFPVYFNYLWIQPNVTIEGRWYYNLNKRFVKNKNTDGNSGNYLAYQVSNTYPIAIFTNGEFNPRFFRVFNSFYFTPQWGIRRKLGNKFHYEFKTGIGVHLSIAKDVEPRMSLSPLLSLRFGYDFSIK